MAGSCEGAFPSQPRVTVVDDRKIEGTQGVMLSEKRLPSKRVDMRHRASVFPMPGKRPSTCFVNVDFDYDIRQINRQNRDETKGKTRQMIGVKRSSENFQIYK